MGSRLNVPIHKQHEKENDKSMTDRERGSMNT